MFRADAADAAGEPGRRSRGYRARRGAGGKASRGSIKLGVPDTRAWTVSDKVATGQGYGFRNIDDPMARVTPGCSDLRPALPGRAVAM